MQQDLNGSDLPLASYKLVIEDNDNTQIQPGEPHLILRRKPVNETVDLESSSETPEVQNNSMKLMPLPEESDPAAEKRAEPIESEAPDSNSIEHTQTAQKVAQYVASLVGEPEDEAATEADSAGKELPSDELGSPPTMVSAGEVADYISNLSNHVPDDVSRVVDAIIAEEKKLPRGLPTLDEVMPVIYSNTEESLPVGDGIEKNAEEIEPQPGKTHRYVKKVEYEDR